MKPVHRPGEPGDPPPNGEERRAHPRIPAEQLPGLTASLTPDMGVRLIDISRGGALFECRKRVIPGSEVALRLVTRDGTHIVRGRVVRSRVVRLDTGAMGYQTAVAFNETLKDLLPEPAAPAGVEDTGAIPREDPAAANAADDAWRATPVILLTASIPGTSAELREMFTNNDW